MSKESLFKHIRSQDVVLWIGAGFSKYAGYPLGNQLRDLLAASLSPTEKDATNIQASLPDFSEDFVQLKNDSRHELVQLIKSVYRKAPESVKDHQHLSSLPFFKNIVTTNYDSLIEDAYGESGNLIFRAADVSLVDKKKTNIFKIHGDLSDPSTIIITKSDYARLYHADRSSPFWSHINSLLATNVVVFIGYSLEDPNVISMLEHIGSYLKQLKREAFFVAPQIPRHKIAHLAKMGIEAIEMTGAAFLAEVEQDIRKNIFGDQRSNRVSIDTLREALRPERIVPDVLGTEFGYIVTGVRSLDGKPVVNKISMRFPAEGEIGKSYEAFAKGESQDLVINPKLLDKFAVNVQGFEFLGKDDLEELRIFRSPETFIFDLTFPGNDLEFANLEARLFRGKQPKITTHIHNLDITISVEDQEGNKRVNFGIHRKAAFTTVKAAIEACTFLKLFFSKAYFTVHFKNGRSISQHNELEKPEFIKQADNFLAYFSLMKEVEDAYHVRFRTIGEITDKNLQKLQRLVKIAKKSPFKLETNALRLTMSEITPEMKELGSRLETVDGPIDVEFTIKESIMVHGLKFKLSRRRLHVPAARLLNLKEVVDDNAKELEVVSKTGNIYEFFEAEQLTR